MNLQPSEFIAKTRAPDNNPQRIATYNMAPGTVVRLRNHIFVLVDASNATNASKGPHQWIHAQTGRSLSHEQFAARMRGDLNNLPVILFNPLDTDTDTNTENNNDND